MKTRIALLALAFAGLTIHSTQATTLGFSTDPTPSWDREDADTAYGIYDTFSGFSFTGDAAGSSSGFTTSLALDQATALTGNPGTDQGAGTYNNLSTFAAGGDVLYSGGLGTSFTLTGETDFEIHGFVLQIKRAANTASLIGEISPTLNGIGYDNAVYTSGSGDTTSNDGYWSVTTYYWNTSLAAETDTSFTLAFSGPMHRGIDGIVVDAANVAAAVPEPSTYLLMGLGLGSLWFLARRRKLAATRC